MERLYEVLLLVIVPVCLGVSSAWSFADEEHGRRGNQGVVGSVSKKGSVFQYREGVIKGTDHYSFYCWALSIDGPVLTPRAADKLSSRVCI